MSERDDALEEAALAIERPDFAEWRGVLSKTKKGQREYEIRVEAIRETKRRMAEYIRSFKSGQGNDPRTALARLAERLDAPVYDIPGAWRMADLGWLNISVTIPVTERTIPAHVEHRISLTTVGSGCSMNIVSES